MFKKTFYLLIVSFSLSASESTSFNSNYAQLLQLSQKFNNETITALRDSTQLYYDVLVKIFGPDTTKSNEALDVLPSLCHENVVKIMRGMPINGIKAFQGQLRESLPTYAPCILLLKSIDVCTSDSKTDESKKVALMYLLMSTKIQTPFKVCKMISFDNDIKITEIDEVFEKLCLESEDAKTIIALSCSQ